MDLQARRRALAQTPWRRGRARHPCPEGWDVEALILDEHPITGKPFKQYQWWIKETYTGELT